MGWHSIWLSLGLARLARPSQAAWSVGQGGPALSQHAAAWDGEKLWIHGGYTAPDLWTFENETWQSVAVGLSPALRTKHVALWDPWERTLWIHGGISIHGSFLKDLWKFSVGEWTWVADLEDVARSDHVAVWDDTRCALWIHGGMDSNLKGDMWRFDIKKDAWTQIQQTGPPTARAHHVAAWDGQNQAIWIHGGWNHSFTNEVWKFDTLALSWELRSTDGPIRAHHASAWDSTSVLWIHGGFNGFTHRDLWKFDTSTSVWTLMDPEGPGRYDHVMAYRDHELWLHGGIDGVVRSELWRFVVTSTSTTATTTFSATSSTTETWTRSSTTTTTRTSSSSTGTRTTETQSSQTLTSQTSTSLTSTSSTGTDTTVTSTSTATVTTTLTSTTLTAAPFLGFLAPLDEYLGVILGFAWICMLSLWACLVLMYCKPRRPTMVVVPAPQGLYPAHAFNPGPRPPLEPPPPPPMEPPCQCHEVRQARQPRATGVSEALPQLPHHAPRADAPQEILMVLRRNMSPRLQ